MSRANQVFPEVPLLTDGAYAKAIAMQAQVEADHMALVSRSNKDHVGRQADFAAITSLAREGISTDIKVVLIQPIERFLTTAKQCLSV